MLKIVQIYANVKDQIIQIDTYIFTVFANSAQIAFAAKAFKSFGLITCNKFPLTFFTTSIHIGIIFSTWTTNALNVAEEYKL